MPLSYIIQVILDEIIIVLYLKYHLQDIYERYWDLDTTFGKWNLDSAKKKMAHTKFLTVHFETGTIPPIYVLELVV